MWADELTPTTGNESWRTSLARWLAPFLAGLSHPAPQDMPAAHRGFKKSRRSQERTADGSPGRLGPATISFQRLAEWSAYAVSCIYQNAAEAHICHSGPADLLDGDLRLGQGDLSVGRHLRLCHALRIESPAVRQEQAKADRNQHLTRCSCSAPARLDRTARAGSAARPLSLQ